VRRLLSILLLIGVLLLANGSVRAQEGDAATRFYALINEARLDEGLPPYEQSRLLTAAAQGHADDLLSNNLASHVGSNGLSAAERIAEVGYVAWGSGATVGENFWTGYGTVEEAFDWFMDDPPHRDNILNARYREVGIGVATAEDGKNYYVLDFGARPNVLPIFINDGAETAESSQVAIRLTNEEANPQGQGTAYMGQAIEVRVSDTPDFEGMPWQPWEPLIAWTLPQEPGEHTVYVQFRDGADRTAAAADSILLLSETGSSLPPTETPPPPTLPPSVTPPPSPSLTPFLTPTAPPTASPAPASVSTPEDAPGSPPGPVFTASPSPPAAQVAAVTRVPFPTWTPLPRLTTGGGGGLDPLLGWICGLEVIAVLIGISLALRRSRS